MRHVRSFGSVKAISLDRPTLIRKLERISSELIVKYPEVERIYLFGSLARCDHTGTSDVDLLVFAEPSGLVDPVESTRPYHKFFADELKIGVDLIVRPAGTEAFPRRVPGEAVLLAERKG